MHQAQASRHFCLFHLILVLLQWGCCCLATKSHFHALEKEMATHSSILTWRTPGMGDPGGLLSMGSQRVGHNWSDLAAAAATCLTLLQHYGLQPTMFLCSWDFPARIMEWAAISFSKGSSRYRDWPTPLALAGGLFTAWPPGKLSEEFSLNKIRLYSSCEDNNFVFYSHRECSRYIQNKVQNRFTWQNSSWEIIWIMHIYKLWLFGTQAQKCSKHISSSGQTVMIKIL